MTIAEPLAPQRLGISESRFTAMGGGAHVMVVGGKPSLVQAARRHIEALEASWSRFRPSSELSRLNARPGRLVQVSQHLFDALERAVEAWRLTDGLFDPTVLGAIEAMGYDRTFDRIGAHAGGASPSPAPGCASIELDRATRSVALPDGVGIDLGGIGKGLAADLVVTELFRLGAEGALVNIGGDLRVAGMAPSPDGWVIEIEDPFRRSGRGVCVVLADGAVATSSVLEKRWTNDGGDVHHLIDPRTGRCGATLLSTVTVVAAEGWWAEALTKAVFLLDVDDGLDLLERAGVHGLLFLADGANAVAGRWKDILA
jgi:thiamine biosynthesis lipoprotein